MLRTQNLKAIKTSVAITLIVVIEIAVASTDISQQWLIDNRQQGYPTWEFSNTGFEDRYIITGDLELDGSLKINPGVFVTFLRGLPKMTFLDGGWIDAIGTEGEANMITIQPEVLDFEGYAGWIRLDDSAGESIFEWVVFRWNVLLNRPYITALDCDGLTVNHCNFSGVLTNVKVLGNGTRFDFEDCEFSADAPLFGASYPTVIVYNGNVEFKRCSFQRAIEDADMLLIDGSSTVSVTDFCSFDYNGGNLESTPYAIHFKNVQGASPIDCQISDCNINGTLWDGINGGGILIDAGEVEVTRCLIHDLWQGIVVNTQEGDNGPVFIHNNLVVMVSNGVNESSNPDYGVGIWCLDQGNGDLKIYNNIVCNVVSEDEEEIDQVQCIRLSETSAAEVRYNTLCKSDDECIFVEGLGSGSEGIYNNVLSDWDLSTSGASAISYGEDDPEDDEPVDFNVYCTSNFLLAEPPNYLGNVGSPGGGPGDVYFKRFIGGEEDPDPIYYPYGEDKQNDEIFCRVYNLEEPYDFHLIPQSADEWGLWREYPPWIEQGNNPEEEDCDEPVTYPIRYAEMQYGRRLRRVFGPSHSDAGAYGGPYGNGFSKFAGPRRDEEDDEWVEEYYFMWNDYITDEVTGDASHFFDPFVWADGESEADLWWDWDVDRPSLRGEYFRFTGNNDVSIGTGLFAEGCAFLFPQNAQLIVNGTIDAQGSSDYPVEFLTYTGTWKGIKVTSQATPSTCTLDYVRVGWADNGFYLSGVGGGSQTLAITHALLDSCLTGIYANNSRVSITNSTITNSPSSTGKGVYLVNCSAGMVVMDHDTITHNGTVADYSNTGVYLSSSSPEITDCLIEDNFGSGVACFNSNPDLHTYYSGTSHANDIHSNGEGGSQSGSNGAEIYLASASYPSIHYNNIWDQNGQNQTQGKLIYKSSSCPSALSATNNYWGVGTPQSSWWREEI